MNKEFNYKEELKRMFKSLGGNGNGCGCVDCNDCPLDSGKFENKESRCAGIGYEEEMIEIVRKWSEENPPIQRQINWKKVPMNTKVMVQNDGYFNTWVEKYFGWYEENGVPFVCFGEGRKSYESYNIVRYSYCKLAPCVEIKEEWYE